MKFAPKRWFLAAFLCALVFSVSRTWAAADMFLKLPGIDGESTDAAHPKEIVVLAFSQGVAGGGVTGGRPTFSDLTITKMLDSASPLLYVNAAQGTHIQQAILTVRSSGATPFEYYKITLTDVIITSVQTSGSTGDSRPTESLSLNYAKIEWRYTPQKPDGSAGTQVIGTWDVARNTP